MKHSTGTPTKAQRRRFMLLQEMGCVCSWIEGLGYIAPQIHHLVEGNRRLGHDYTIPLSPWHHMGIPWEGYQLDDMLFIAGPSLALNKRLFVETYGTERSLLAKVNERLERLEMSPV